jgi:alkanesulfonate monooxygenase SsuD/methylene tetrahydromethanopterin reductase-like flavin-dependent oxidoreductase (luciferase family)
MRFGLIYELQLPRPWDAESEHRMVQHALVEVEAADRLGFDYVWANEHHFLEEYSHNSAPEVFLAAAADLARLLEPRNDPRRRAQRGGRARLRTGGPA